MVRNRLSLAANSPMHSLTLAAHFQTRSPRAPTGFGRSGPRRYVFAQTGTSVDHDGSPPWSVGWVVRLSELRRERFSGDGVICPEQRTRQPIECDRVRDHQHGDVEDRDDICGAQLACHKRKAQPGGLIVVDEDVGCAQNVEGDNCRGNLIMSECFGGNG